MAGAGSDVRGGELKHYAFPSRALDVAFLLTDGAVVWLGLLSKFARLMKAADARVHWGGGWPEFKTVRILRYESI